MTIYGLVQIMRDTFREWRDEDITRLGAALAYFAAFSLFPLFLLSTLLVGALFGPTKVENQVVRQISGLVDQQTVQTIRDAVEHVTAKSQTSTITIVISIIALLNGATGFFRHLKSALNIIWSVPPVAPTKVHGFLRDTLLSLVAVVGLGIVLLVMMVLHGVGFAMLQSFDRIFPNADFLQLWQLLGGLILFLFTLFTFVLIYKLLPDAKISWRDVWVGSFVTAILFTAGQFLLVTYVTTSNMESLFGATSVLLIILTWVYFSAHLLLFGAEFTQVYANQRGSKIVPTS